MSLNSVNAVHEKHNDAVPQYAPELKITNTSENRIQLTFARSAKQFCGIGSI